MIVALAQTHSAPTNVDANIPKHVEFITAAVQQGAQAVFFAELSLTSYYKTTAATSALAADAAKLQVFEQLAKEHNVVIGIGVPTVTADSPKPRVSMIFFQPSGDSCSRLVYSKQHLASSEVDYFSPGTSSATLKLGQLVVTPAICFESTQDVHFDECLKLGSNVYLACVAEDEANYFLDWYAGLSKRMGWVWYVNSLGDQGIFTSCGQSAVWKDGVLVGRCEDKPGILLLDVEAVTTRFVAIP
ncbi:hypothetical protein HDV03_001346 [Kappamyces sp. JEL0829]|nr:hypothetical protein HDV03_001346 [Kappamyces sp. JEL0829]